MHSQHAPRDKVWHAHAQPTSACLAVIREPLFCTVLSLKRSIWAPEHHHSSAFKCTCTSLCRPDLVVGHGTHHIVGSHKPGKLVIELEDKKVSSCSAAGHQCPMKPQCGVPWAALKQSLASHRHGNWSANDEAYTGCANC